MSNTRKATAAPARSFADILATAKPRETEVRLCLAGDLAAEADRLSAELEALGSRFAPSSLAEVDPRAAIDSELAEVHDQMRAAEETFRFRALGPKAWSDLEAAHPGRTADEAWNPDTFAPALVAASSIAPAMSLQDVEALFEVLNDRQRGQLFTAAYQANRGETRVPFSPAASPNRSSSGAK